jgi:hypothetical protein
LGGDKAGFPLNPADKSVMYGKTLLLCVSKAKAAPISNNNDQQGFREQPNHDGFGFPPSQEIVTPHSTRPFTDPKEKGDYQSHNTSTGQR